MKTAVIVFLCCICGNNVFCQEWIPYQEQTTQTVVQQTSVIYKQPQPVIVYQLVPYVVQQPVLVEKQCFFHRTSFVSSRPVVQWVYQPILVYR